MPLGCKSRTILLATSNTQLIEEQPCPAWTATVLSSRPGVTGGLVTTCSQACCRPCRTWFASRTQALWQSLAYWRQREALSPSNFGPPLWQRLVA
eukprot:2346576-Amphidinium_carterae.1